MFKRIYLEITNNCNLDCSFCIKNNQPKKFLSLEEFKIILSKIKNHTKYLYFHVLGEPLVHPQINEFINIASDYYFINITTNGYLINKIKDNKNIRQINISLHSFHPKYNKSLKNYLKDIFDTVNNLVLNNTIIKFRLWVNSPYKDKIILALNKQYQVQIKDEKKLKINSHIYYEIEEEFIWPSYDNNYFNPLGTCRGTKDFIGILVSGTVIPCCLDSSGIINLGNIYKEDLSDIINSDLFKKINTGFCQNHKYHKLCQKCNFYDLRKNKKNEDVL